MARLRPPSPQTRGSTRIAAFPPCVPCPIPAHAGINPAVDAERNGSVPYPRARGNQPALMLCELPGYSSSPRTRGSTQRYVQSWTPVRLIPPHAGINPRNHRDRFQEESHLRTRRNQPFRDFTVAPRPRPSRPHAGINHGENATGARNRGPLPPHAGINP